MDEQSTVMLICHISSTGRTKLYITTCIAAKYRGGDEGGGERRPGGIAGYGAWLPVYSIVDNRGRSGVGVGRPLRPGSHTVSHESGRLAGSQAKGSPDAAAQAMPL